MKNIRVRWAPSNTGPDIHIGNLRTILYNYLFAKKNNGTCIFRIEDTDTARSKPEYADAIANSLNWVGITADEGYKIGGDYGPYSQMAKVAHYKQVADKLIESGHAYRCYCTNEELDTLRNSLPESTRHTFRYPGLCRDRKDTPSLPFVVRFKATTEGSIEFDDTVFGHMNVPNKENFDFVIIRADGSPLFVFANAIDDIDQRITHCIRGRDHLLNTPLQIMLFDALGIPRMSYAHLSMIRSPDGKAKLSKRDGTVSLTDYRKLGYTPSGILNYLAKLGWSADGNTEIFTMESLIEKFSLDACGRNDARFDPKKFAAIQYEHLKNNSLTSDEAYVRGVLPLLKNRGAEVSGEQVLPAVRSIRHKCKTLVDAAYELEPIFKRIIEVDPVAAEKFLTSEWRPHLKDLATNLQSLASSAWTDETVKEATTRWLAKRNMELKAVQQSIRVSLTGRTNSPELFQVMVLLGRDMTLERLNG